MVFICSLGLHGAGSWGILSLKLTWKWQNTLFVEDFMVFQSRPLSKHHVSSSVSQSERQIVDWTVKGINAICPRYLRVPEFGGAICQVRKLNEGNGETRAGFEKG